MDNAVKYNSLLNDDVSDALDNETVTQQTVANATVLQPDIAHVDDIPIIRNLFDRVQSAFKSSGH